MSEINMDIYQGNIITSRIRLARNVKGYPFRIKNASEAKEMVKKVNRTLRCRLNFG